MARNPIKWSEDGWHNGNPSLELMSNAIQVWAILNGGSKSVSEACEAFNTVPESIIEAVESHYWMFLTGPRYQYDKLMIEHEGE